MICNRWSFADRLQIRQLQARLACTSENVEQELFTHPAAAPVDRSRIAASTYLLVAKAEEVADTGHPVFENKAWCRLFEVPASHAAPTRNSNRKAAPEL
jgi:hypothetical protein